MITALAISINVPTLRAVVPCQAGHIVAPAGGEAAQLDLAMGRPDPTTQWPNLALGDRRGLKRMAIGDQGLEAG